MNAVEDTRTPLRNGNFHFGNLQVEISIEMSTFINGIPLRLWRTMEISVNFHSPLWKFPFVTQYPYDVLLQRVCETDTTLHNTDYTTSPLHTYRRNDVVLYSTSLLPGGAL